MSKYEPLKQHLKRKALEHVPMTFEEVEGVLGFPLPASASTHRAWWSNNPTNNVMTYAWKGAGYITSDVDMDARRLVFRRAGSPGGDVATATAAAAVPPPAQIPDHTNAEARRPSNSLLGRLKGYLVMRAGTDLTAPAEPDWPQPDSATARR